MPEPFHIFGNDLVLAADGDLLLVDSVDETNQRIIRRLLTAQGGYLWHLGYGAGLPGRVGLKVTAKDIAQLVRAQIFQEATVAPSPAPVIGVTVNASGIVVCDITYTYAPTGQSVTLQIPVTSP